MKTIRTAQSVEIPAGVTVTCNARTITVKGPRGSLTRSFKHLQLDIRKEGKRVVVELWMGNRASIASVRTVCTHIKNMLTGVTKGFHYNMRLVYAHFPINCAINTVGDATTLEIRNFLGQKIVRRVNIPQGITISRSESVKDQLELQGNDLELLGQTTATIHQICTVKDKDIRKFLDGIYVSQKGLVGEFSN
jgi:large subunit ribosomal protein L9e